MASKLLDYNLRRRKASSAICSALLPQYFTRPASINESRVYMAIHCILTNMALYIGRESDSGEIIDTIAIRISGPKEAIKKDDDRKWFGKAALNKAKDVLEHAGLIELDEKGNSFTRKATTYRPTEKFTAALITLSHQDHVEPLGCAKAYLDDEPKPILDLIINDGEQLEDLDELKRDLRAYNEHVLSFSWTLPPILAVKYPYLVTDKSNGKLRPSSLVAMRIFDGPDYKGRFHTGYQQLKTPHRREMLCDGHPLIELDYASMQPSIAYALEGIKPPSDIKNPTGTLRDLRYSKAVLFAMLFDENRAFGWDGDEPFIKMSSLAPILTSTRKDGAKRKSIIEKANGKVLAAFHHAVDYGFPDLLAIEWNLESCLYDDERTLIDALGYPLSNEESRGAPTPRRPLFGLQEIESLFEGKSLLSYKRDKELIVETARAIVEGHRAIEPWLGRAKGAVTLQRWESRIAENVIGGATAKGIPLLVVHDSFLTTREHEEKLKATMAEAFMETMKVNWHPTVKSNTGYAYTDLSTI